MRTKSKTWETTREPNLLRNAQSGRYYARFKIAGNQKWINLETDEWKVAVNRIADERVKIARGRVATSDVERGVASMGQLAEMFLTRIRENSDLAVTSRTRYEYSICVIKKTWPGFEALRPERVTRAVVLAWRDRLREKGTGFVCRGGAGKPSAASSTTVNKSISMIRGMLQIAVERGQLATNPLLGRGINLRLTPRKPQLPEAATLEKIFQKIETRGRWTTRACAEFLRFIAYSGCRKSEASSLVWRDVDFARGLIRVNGTKTECAEREVPMIPAARELLEKIHAHRLDVLRKTVSPTAAPAPFDRVFLVAEAPIALARACREVGCEKLTHHDLRDAFATSCIESGVDIPTVAAWLGHADGGALLMRTYAHHRRQHSLAQAAKVGVGR